MHAQQPLRLFRALSLLSLAARFLNPDSRGETTVCPLENFWRGCVGAMRCGQVEDSGSTRSCAAYCCAAPCRLDPRDERESAQEQRKILEEA